MPEWWKMSRDDAISDKPLLHPKVVAYLESLLKPEMKVIEHGSGGSTLWFAERVQRVTAIETDEGMYEKVREAAPENVTVLLWGRGKYPALYNVKYDLFLIDGEPIEDRGRFMEDVERFMVPGGIVVLDNANRPEYRWTRLKLMKKAKLLEAFDMNEPGVTSYMVTEFYQLPGSAPVKKARKKAKK